MKILIAEDETTIANSLKKNFADEGHDALIANDGENAINKIKENDFDAILLDWRMPKLSGLEVCKKLRSEGFNKPIILLTALTDISNKVEALNTGADDYITKPVRAKKLLELISNRLLRIEELNSTSSEKLPQNISKTEDEKILIKSEGKHILAVLDDIIIIKVKGDYSEVLLKTGEKALIKKTLNSWEKTLPEKTFLRIHRNTIINSK